MRYLTGGERPDHDTVCAFRVSHLEGFRALFVDTLRVAGQEDERYGKGRRGDELPEEMKDPKKRAERLREAARQVEAEKKVALAVR